MTVVLSTARLRLRPLVSADAARLLALSGEDGMRRWLPDQVYRDDAHARQVADALAAQVARGADPRARSYVLGVEHAATGALIGHVGLSPARGSVEIGYAIEQRLHGLGLATEAVTALSAWALAELGLPEVLGVVDADNVASCRVLEKAGFTRAAEEPGTLAGRACTVRLYRRAGR